MLGIIVVPRHAVIVKECEQLSFVLLNRFFSASPTSVPHLISTTCSMDSAAAVRCLPRCCVFRPCASSLCLGSHSSLLIPRCSHRFWGPIVGLLAAVISFVCSVGNIPLAAVLWNGGISFGGVIASSSPTRSSSRFGAF